MKKTTFILIALLIAFVGSTFAQKTYTFPASPNKVTAYAGDIADGSVISDLSWAWNSSVACFPGTEAEFFNGNQIFYITSIPPFSEMTITVIPSDKNDNMSIYAYQVGENNNSMPPNLTSCLTCESERKWDRPKVGRTQDHTRSVYLNALQDPWKVVIAVVGANGLKTGKFTLQVDLKTSMEDTNTQQAVTAKTIQVEANKPNSFIGDLKDGVFIYDLSWASTSSMACFPGTQNLKFNGKHVLFVTTVPENAEITISVIPDDKSANFSIYAIQTGLNVTELPPNVTQCIACEAEHKWDYQKVGKTQDHTRSVYLNSLGGEYRIAIGVCGANKLETGGFTLKIDVVK